MWGSDYPLTANRQNYRQSLEVIASATDRLTRPERDRLLAGTARHVYGLPEGGVPSGS
jgi:predicted TIM-barrel fold metal-dependent hydrolase